MGFMKGSRVAAALIAGSLAGAAGAAEVAVVGLFPGKAVLVIDGGPPRTVAVGAQLQGVRVVAVEDGAATVEIDGRRHRLRIGESPVSAAPSDAGKSPEVKLIADGRGHFVVGGTINGVSTRFLVDTGATFVSVGRSEAARAGIRLEGAEQGLSMTANGPAKVWKVRLASVSVGPITLRDIDGLVHESEMPIALLGMSFLNRMEMRRDGEALTLKRRY